MKISELKNLIRSNNPMVLVLLATALLSVSCAAKNQMLIDAKAKVQDAEQNTHINKFAPVELREAKMTLAKAKKAKEDRDIEHYAEMASAQVDIAKQTANQKSSESELEALQDSRTDILLEARNREVKAAGKKARLDNRRVEAAENRAGKAEAKAQKAQSKAVALSVANKSLEGDLKNLQGTIANLEAKETERGLELTLKDVLFENNQSTLKSGNERTISQLVQFLGKSPGRDVLIEGHTDSVGSTEYNRVLSEKRAQTVQSLFNAQGISSSRLRAEGYGEAYPVASNDSKAGRQQNRRVEIIMLNENEKAQDNVRK